MIIVNTTFNVALTARDSFIAHIKGHYIPVATADGTMRSPRLARVLSHNADAIDTASYALQFEADSLDAVEEWYDRCGRSLNRLLTKKYADAIAGFSTLMQTID